MEQIKISPPWIQLEHMIDALFGQDPEIQIVKSGEYEEERRIKLLVANTDKAAALEKILPSQKVFGNVTVHLIVVPANPLREGQAALFTTAFKGNPIVTNVISASGLFDATYVVFENKVVQYFCDNMGDPFGNISTLFEDIAREVFEDTAHVFFCTSPDQ